MHNDQRKASSTFHRHSPAGYEPSQVHQRSMPFGLTWMGILNLKIDPTRLQTPGRWVAFSFSNSYGLSFGPFSEFLTLSSSTKSGAYWFLLLHFHFRSRFLPLDLPSNFIISLVLFLLLFPASLCPPSDFDKLNSPTFPNSLFFLSVVLSKSSPGQAKITFGILSSLG